MITFFKEENGDYLAVNKDIEYRQFESLLGGAQYQALVTGAPGDPDSIYATSVSQSYLSDECTPVDREEVPQEWREAILDEFEKAKETDEN
jgi:hypothetical protein